MNERLLRRRIRMSARIREWVPDFEPVMNDEERTPVSTFKLRVVYWVARYYSLKIGRPGSRRALRNGQPLDVVGEDYIGPPHRL